MLVALSNSSEISWKTMFMNFSLCGNNNFKIENEARVYLGDVVEKHAGFACRW